MTGQGRGWIIRVGVNRRITEGDIFFLAYRTNFFRSNYALENETTRPVSPRIRSAIPSADRVHVEDRVHQPNPPPNGVALDALAVHQLRGSRFIQLLGIKGRGVASRWRIIVSPLSGRGGKERIMGKGKGKGSDISGTEIFRGIEKIFRSNERITSWNKLEQQVEKVEEGRSLCMGRELDRKNCSSPVSLFMHRRTRTHTHARTFIHAYIRTYRSLLRISISTCLYNVLSLCFSIAQAHRGPAVVQVQYSTQKFPISTAQRHLRRLS